MFGGDGVERSGEVGGVFEHAEPGVVRVADLRFLLGVAERGEHELGGVAEGFGFFDGDAVLGQGSKNFAEDVVDVGGGEEVAGERGGEFGADALGLDALALFTRMEGAQAGMIGMAKHAAAATVGEREMAKIVIGSVGTLVHEKTPL